MAQDPRAEEVLTDADFQSQPSEETLTDSDFQKSDGPQSAGFAPPVRTTYLSDKGVTVAHPDTMSDADMEQSIWDNYYTIPIKTPGYIGDILDAERRAEQPAGERIQGPEQVKPATMGEQVAYPFQRVFSQGIEKPAWALTEGILRSLVATDGASAGLVGMAFYKFAETQMQDVTLAQDLKDHAPGFLDRAIEFYGHPEKYGMVTPAAEEMRGRLREANYSRNYLLGLAGDTTEAITDLLAFMATAEISTGSAIGKGAGAAMESENMIAAFSKSSAKLSAYAFLTTKGDLSDRAKSAIYIIAYNMTPYIANATGAVGLSAMAVNAALNTFLAMPQYVKAIQEAGGINKESAALIIPQFIMDFGFSYNTRGTPENQMKAKVERYARQRAKELDLPADQVEIMVKAMQDFIQNPPKETDLEVEGVRIEGPKQAPRAPLEARQAAIEEILALETSAPPEDGGQMVKAAKEKAIQDGVLTALEVEAMQTEETMALAREGRVGELAKTQEDVLDEIDALEAERKALVGDSFSDSEIQAKVAEKFGQQKDMEDYAFELRQKLKKTTDKEKQAEIKGVISDLKEQIAGIKREIRELEDLKREPATTKKLEKIDEKLESLVEQYDDLDAQMAELLQPEGELPVKDSQMVRLKASQVIRQAKKSFTAGVKAGTAAEKEQQKVRDAESKESQKQRLEDVKTAQEAALDLIESVGLSAADRARFMRDIKNIQSAEDFLKVADRLEQKALTLSEKTAKKVLQGRLKRELKKTTVSKEGGKPSGRFTAEIQTLLDSARQAGRTKADVAQVKIQENVDKINDMLSKNVDPSEIYRLALQNEILNTVANFDTVTSEQLADTLETIQDLKAVGRTSSKLEKKLQAKNIAAKRDRYVQVISGGKGLPAKRTASEAKDVLDTPAGAVKKFFRSVIFGWNDLMDVMSQKDKGSKAGQSFLSKDADVFEYALKNKMLVRKFNLSAQKALQDAYGLKAGETNKKLRELQRPVDFGSFKRADGQTEQMVMTKDQAIKKWMEYQDPTLKATFESVEGMAWTKDMIDAIEKTLTPEDKAFGKAQFAVYKEIYAEANAVYSKIYGVNLPFNEFYSPIRREHQRDPAGSFGEFLQEAKTRAGIRPASTISRVKNENQLKLIPSMQTLQRHIAEMSHFIAWAEKVREMRSIFFSDEVQNAIKSYYGKGTAQIVNGFIDDFTANGSNKAHRIGAMGNWMDAWRTNFTKAKTGLRPSIAVKQLTGFLAFSENVPAKDFAAGLVKFWADPVKNFKMLSDADFLKTRWESIDRDIADALKTDAYKAFRKNPTFTNALMLNVQLGDKGAIVMGGFPLYNYLRNSKGMTHEEALLEFSKTANRTQQSGDIAELSEFQRGGPLAKLFTMFMSSPNQYLRRELFAIRNAMSGRMSAAQAAKTIALYHFVMPMIFQAVSDLGFDPKKQARAAALGSMNGIFIVSDFLEAAINKALGERTYDNELPMYSVGGSVSKLANKVVEAFEYGLDTEEVIEGINALLDIGDHMTGLPLAEGAKMVESLGKIYDEEYKEAIGGFLGWPDSTFKDDE